MAPLIAALKIQNNKHETLLEFEKYLSELSAFSLTEQFCSGKKTASSSSDGFFNLLLNPFDDTFVVPTFYISSSFFWKKGSHATKKHSGRKKLK